MFNFGFLSVEDRSTDEMFSYEIELEYDFQASSYEDDVYGKKIFFSFNREKNMDVAWSGRIGIDEDDDYPLL